MERTMERNGWLPHLDRMLMIDRQGAIHDMLQVLHERGVIQKVSASSEERMGMSLVDDEGYRRSVHRHIGDLIGRFLVDEKQIKFVERETERYEAKIIQGTIEIVRRSSEDESV